VSNIVPDLPWEMTKVLGLDKPRTLTNGARAYPRENGHDTVYTDYELSPCVMCGGKVNRAVRCRDDGILEIVSMQYHHCMLRLPYIDSESAAEGERIDFHISKNRDWPAEPVVFDWSLALFDLEQGDSKS